LGYPIEARVMPAWTHRILLNAVDITGETLLGAQVDEGENVSHVADLTWRPPSGAQDTDGLTLQTLVIDVDMDAGGWKTIFSGRVIRATWEPVSRTYAIRASNRLQEHFRALGSHTAVLAALPGAVYSEALHGEPADDLWEYAQRCMETLEADVHLDRTNALAQIAWAAKGTPDHTVNATPYGVHNTPDFQLIRPEADELINEVSIEYDYRVSRWKTRTHAINWSAWNNNTDIDSWCDWAIGPLTNLQFILPDVSLLESVLLGSSWHAPDGVAYSTHPESGANLCAVDDWVWARPEGSERIATQGGATGYRSLSQPIFETYKLTFQAVAAQTFYGATVSDFRSGAAEPKADPAWPPENAPAPDPTWLTDTIGDAYQDQEDETRRANDLQAFYQWSSARIRGSQRGIGVLFRTDCRPDITLADTVEVSAHGLQARGKVRRLRYVLEAAPYLEVTLAISRGNGGTDTPWVVPARPDTTDPGYPAPPASTTIGTFVGGFTGAPEVPDPDNRRGWITNVNPNATGFNPTAPQYDPTFRAEWPEIEDAAAQEVTVGVPSTWEIAVPHDLLTVT
jgi:hypothetical protein